MRSRVSLVTLPSRSPASVLACGFAGMSCVLVLPYFFPVTPVLSASYCFGFSNRAALAIFVLFAAAFAWWRGEIAPSNDTAETLRKQSLFSALGVAVLVQAALWVYASRYGAVQEASYLTDRLEHLASGRSIFRDFEFIYGPGLLYTPLWINRALGISLLNAYFLALLLENVAGVLCLWRTVRAFKSPHANAIFFLLFATSLSWAYLCGAQYTPFRYWLGPCVACIVYRRFRDQRLAPALLTLAAGFALLMFYFPEQALALLIGSAVFWLAFQRRAEFILPLLAAVPILFYAYQARALDTLMAMSSGGYAIPVVPSLYLLPCVGLLLVSACTLLSIIRRGDGGDEYLYLLCIGIPLLPAAFGRFAQTHLVANTLAVALVAWVVISKRERYWRWAAWGYAVIVLAVPLPRIAREVYHLASYAAYHGRLTSPVTSPVYYTPMGPVGIWTRKAHLSFAFDTGRFYGNEDLMTAAQVQQKVSEIRQHATLVLPPDFDCKWEPTRKEVLTMTMGFYVPPARHQTTLLQPICDELHAHFRRSETLPGDMQIWKAMPRAAP